MATVFQSSSKEYLRTTRGIFFEKYSEKASSVNDRPKLKILKYSTETENILPKNTNSEIIQNSLNTVQAAPRFHSEKALPATQACSSDLFLREISRAPFRGNKWLSSLELAARRAKLIGKTHVRTPQVRRLLPKRELVRKGSEKTAKSACPRRHAAPIRRPEKTLPTAQPRDRGRVPVGPDLSRLEVTSLLPPQSSDRKPAPQPTLLGRGGAPPLRAYEPATQIAADGYARPKKTRPARELPHQRD